MQNPFARCETECCGDEGDYSTCERFHTEDEHTDFGHCVKAAYLSYGCEICAECITISQELRDGKTPQRICHECQYLFDLNAENPYDEVLFDENVGVYFECDECFTRESGFITVESEMDAYFDELEDLEEYM